MKLGKRIAVLLLTLVLVLPFVADAIPANAASGDVTRAEWISKVVDTFDMTVDDTSTMPDNYYSDLTTDNPYYQDILLAVEFGLIDIEAGYPFRPNDPATREFAAHTLNFALGFQFDESAGYTFSESSIVTYPNDIQVAINRGWFSLSGGSFMPEQPITEAEAANMLVDAAQVLAENVIGDGSDNHIEFADWVVVIPQETNVVLDTASKAVTITGYTGSIVTGDTFVVFIDEMPHIYEAESVQDSGDGTITISTLDLTKEEALAAIVSMSYSGTEEADLADFEAAEDATFYVRDSSKGSNAPVQILSISPQSVDYDSNKKEVTATHQVKIDGVNIGSISILMSDVNISYDYELMTSEPYAMAVLTSNVEVSASLTFDLSSYAGVPKSIPIGGAKIGSIAGIELTVDFDLSGGLSATWEGELEAGVKVSLFSDNSLIDFQLIKSYHINSFSLIANVNISVGATIRAYIDIDVPMPFWTLDLLDGELGASAGGVLSVNIHATADGTVLNCVSQKGYLYLKLFYSINYDLIVTDGGKSKTYNIFDESNSPVRFAYHYENGQLVSHCTRGEETGIDPDYEYYTSPDSPYFNPAPGYGQSYEDGSGAVVQIYSYEVEEDDAGQEYAVITGYNGGASALAIPSEIDGYEVREIGKSAFYNDDNIRSVVIPSSVAEIGVQAFGGCDALSNVQLSSNLQRLNYSSFGNCPSLKEIHIPKSLTEVGTSYWTGSVNLQGGPFDGSGLTAVTFEDGTTSVLGGLFYDATSLQDVELLDSMTSIGGSAFRNCTSLETIEIPNSITSIGNSAFNMCESLKAINIPDSVTTIGAMAFQSCTDLSSVKLSNNLLELNYSSFGNCPSLKEIHIPKTLTEVGTSYWTGSVNLQGGPFDGSGLTAVTFEEGTTSVLGGLFYDATSLQDVELLDSMTSIGGSAFRNCTSLETIEIPNSITSIGNSAFNMCESLKAINIPDSVTTIGAMAFQSCTDLSSVKLSNNLLELNYSSFGNCPSLKEIHIPKTLTEVGTSYWTGSVNLQGGPFDGSGLTAVTFEEGTTAVLDGLFYDAADLRDVELLDSMTSIGGSAFRNCTSLETIELPNSITSIGSNAFYMCESLASISIPDSVLSIGTFTFYGCESMVSIRLPQGIDSIGERTFTNCASLEYVDFPDSITIIGDYAFSGCTNLTSIELPDNLSKINTHAFDGDGLTSVIIPDACEIIESYAFTDNTKLAEVALSPSLQEIGAYCFENCDALTSITIPDSVSSLSTSVFNDCDLLAEVVLGNGITEIMRNTFSNCPALNNVVIPYGVTEIGSSAFANCTGLTSITIPRTVTSIETNAFSYKDRMTIYGVPGTYAETFANTNGFTFVPQENAATSVSLNVNELTINDNQEYQLTLTIEPPNFTDAIDWKSSNTDIVTVSQNGLIEGRSIGTATIKVTVGDQSASCKVTVVQPVTSISLNKTSLSLDALETYQLTATAKPSDAYNTKVIWSSSAPEIASVDENGLVTAHKKGTSTITATADDGNGAKRNCTVTVSNNAHVAYSTAQLESSHPYEANCKDVWVLTAEGASYIEVTFDSKTYFEDDFDFVYVYGTGDEPDESNKYTGASLAGQTVRVYGDVIKIKLETDNGGNEWGFKVTDLKTDGKLDPYAEIRAELSSAAALDTDSAKLDAVRELDIDLLAEAMAAEDSQIAGQLAELESGMSLTSDVIVTDSMRGHFTEDDIAVTGAVMNVQNTSSPVTLTIDAPHEADNYADSQYSSAVEFSMTLGNAIEPLEVPVMVTLPVPAGIEPDALVILHELSDGSVDRVEYTLSVEDGQTFASFVVTEFSDFTLAQVENDMFDAKLEGSTASVTVYGSSGSSIVCAVYDADGRMLSSDTRKLAASWQTLEFNVPSGAERVSFILLDSEYRPVMESIEP